jgi:hypothetical protein
MIKDWSLKKDPKFPKGENLSMVLNRVNKFIKFLSLNLKNKKFKKHLVITHNVFIRCLLGSFFRIKRSDWFKLKINHLSKFDFILLNGKIIPNIDRKTLKKLGLLNKLKPLIVQGENIGQTFHFVFSNNAELGFVALSQVLDPKNKLQGNRIDIPSEYYDPIKQDIVVLTRAKNNKGAMDLWNFLKSDLAKEVIKKYGYELS